MQRRCASASLPFCLFHLLPGFICVTAIASQPLDENYASSAGGDSAAPILSNGTQLWPSADSDDVGNNMQYAGLSAVDDRRVGGDGREDAERYEKVVDCPPPSSPPVSVRRITGFQVGVGQQLARLREIQVRHNLKVSTMGLR
jgi:hypothetical protein